MTYNTVTDARHRADPLPVKPESGFGDPQRERRSWRRRTKPSAPAAERSTFPNPEAPTQVIPQVPAVPPKVPALHRDEHTVPDRVAINMIRACSQALAEHWSATRLHEALSLHNEELEKRWHRERDGGRKIEARQASTAQSYADAATAIQAAVTVEQITGRPVDLDPEALGKGLAALSVNAQRVDDRTLVGIPRITDDMSDPRLVETVPAAALPSPVHVPGDGVSPAVPAGDDADSDDTLSHRPRVMVMPAPMTSGGHPEPIGLRNARPAYGEVFSGDWVFDDSGPDGAGVLKLVERVQVSLNGSGDPAAARVFFADGTSRRVKEDRTVRALQAVEAAPLLEKYEAQLAEFEALPLGGAL